MGPACRLSGWGARANLQAEADYIAQDSPAAAAHLVRKLINVEVIRVFDAARRWLRSFDNPDYK